MLNLISLIVLVVICVGGGIVRWRLKKKVDEYSGTVEVVEKSDKKDDDVIAIL